MASEQGPGPTTRLVLLTLALHMSVKGDNCYPKLSTLATETGLHPSTVSKHIEIAIADGWLDRTKLIMPGDGKGWNRVSYSVTFPPQVRLVQDDSQLSATRSDEAGSLPVCEGSRPPRDHTSSMNSTSNSTRNTADPEPDPRPDALWGGLAQQLLNTYPHGWGENGLKRKPSPMDVENSLAPLICDNCDPHEILAAAARFAELTPGKKAQWNKGLTKWLDARNWAQAIEVVQEESPTGTSSRTTSSSVQLDDDGTEIVAALMTLADEAERDVYPGHDRHAEILQEFTARLAEGRPLTSPQGALLAKIAEKVGRGCRPRQTFNCPAVAADPRQQEGLDAAALVARIYGKPSPPKREQPPAPERRPDDEDDGGAFAVEAEAFMMKLAQKNTMPEEPEG